MDLPRRQRTSTAVHLTFDPDSEEIRAAELAHILIQTPASSVVVPGHQRVLLCVDPASSHRRIERRPKRLCLASIWRDQVLQPPASTAYSPAMTGRSNACVAPKSEQRRQAPSTPSALTCTKLQHEREHSALSRAAQRASAAAQLLKAQLSAPSCLACLVDRALAC